jgi:serine/threonine protein kinase
MKEENTKRLIREIKLLGDCNSPFLVKLATLPPTSVVIDSKDYLVYSEELLAGDSLRKLIQNRHNPDIKELATLGLCCIGAVEELQSHSAIHRDIKPDNVVATGDPNRPYVMLDLGVAYVVGGTPLTANPAMVAGTRFYLAPEMLSADFRDNLDFRADLYAIGLTIYEFATQKNPFMHSKDTVYNTIQRIATYKPVALHSLCPDLPADFCKVVDLLLKKRPHLRPNLGHIKKILEGCR